MIGNYLGFSLCLILFINNIYRLLNIAKDNVAVAVVAL